MPLHQKYVSIISRLLPAGAVGVSIFLGSAAVGTANEHPAAAQPGTAKDRVSERLAAIRDAVSAVALPDEGATQPADPNRQLAWGNWWRNGGWYRPRGGWGWPNWHNWRNGWHNWRNWWPNW